MRQPDRRHFSLICSPPAHTFHAAVVLTAHAQAIVPLPMSELYFSLSLERCRCRDAPYARRPDRHMLIITLIIDATR